MIDHPYEADNDNVCIHCGLIGSYGHTEEYRMRLVKRAISALDQVMSLDVLYPLGVLETLQEIRYIFSAAEKDR